MGHQKKLYKKFVATAATATLVASAIVPVASASFSDVADKHEFATYINKAVDAGYIKGYADGTFGINDNLKRSQVVIIIGRYLEKLGYTSDATTSPWSDVKDEEVIKYGNIVKDAKVFTGYADGTLKGGGFITRENMAVVLDRLAKTVTDGTSFSDVAKDIEDEKIADLATANADYQASIQALRDLGISTAENFNPKGNVKRGQFAKFIVTAVEKIAEITPEAPELVVESVNAINAITVVEGTDVLAALPKTVEATVVDSKEKVALDIKWTAPKDFEGKAGDYTFTGTVSSADEKVVISEDKATVTVKVTIITEAAYKAAVAAVKTVAETGTEEEFLAALKEPALGLTFDEKHIGDIKDDENKLAVAGYKTAIAEAFSAATVEEIQAIIDEVDKAVKAYEEKIEAGLVAAILDAKTVSAFKTALEKAEIKNYVNTTSYLNEYRTAIANAKPAKVKEVQAAIDAQNIAKTEAAVAKAEASKKTADVEAAQAILAAILNVNKDFDTLAEDADKDAKTFAQRLTAVTEAIAAEKLTAAINSFKPTITAKQNAEVLDDPKTEAVESVQSTLEVKVTYPEIKDQAAFDKNAELVKDYTIDAVITVPAAFAGTTLTIDGKEYKVKDAAKDATTIEFELSEALGLEAPLSLADGAKGEFTITTTVPYETTTLKAGQYTIGFASVVTKGEGETADVRTLTSTTTDVKVIQDPAIPNAIAAVYAAAKAETDATTKTLKALKDANLVTAGLKDVKDANAAAYATAFKAANATGATIATVQEIVNTVNAAEALKAAIATLEAKPSLKNLQKAEFGWNVDTTKNELPLVAKNEALYVKAIKEDVAATAKANEGKDVIPATYTTVADVKAVIEEVNATLLGKVNAATTVASAKAAVEALVAANTEAAVYYNELTGVQKIKVAEAVVAEPTGYVSEEDLIADLRAITNGATLDKTVPTIESVKVNGTTATYDKGVITLAQGSAVDSIEITMSEAVVLPAGLNVMFDTVAFDANSGAPTDFEGRVYGTVSLKGDDNKTIIIKPSENNGIAAYAGTVTFELSGTVTDLAGNAFSGAIPSLKVEADGSVYNKVTGIEKMTDYIYVETKFQNSFNQEIDGFEVALLDQDGNVVAKNVATQRGLNHANNARKANSALGTTLFETGYNHVQESWTESRADREELAKAVKVRVTYTSKGTVYRSSYDVK